MVKYVDYTVFTGAHVKCINASTVSLQSRKTDLLPYGAIKFDLSK